VFKTLIFLSLLPVSDVPPWCKQVGQVSSVDVGNPFNGSPSFRILYKAVLMGNTAVSLVIYGFNCVDCLDVPVMSHSIERASEFVFPVHPLHPHTCPVLQSCYLFVPTERLDIGEPILPHGLGKDRCDRFDELRLSLREHCPLREHMSYLRVVIIPLYFIGNHQYSWFELWI
jgi:hypothetical protein